MYSKLTINNFRNYSKISIDILKSIIVIYGQNGHGKTNILEAISMFAKGKGLRGSKFDDCVNKKSHQEFWSISFEINHEIYSTFYKKENLKGVRGYIISDKKVKNFAEFYNSYYILWLTYETDRLFLESPSVRRDFIDMFTNTCFADHELMKSKYDKLAKQRLIILKRSINDGILKDETKNWLSIIEDQVVKEGLKIAKNRIETTNILNNSQVYSEFSRKYKNKMVGELENIIASCENDEEIENRYKISLVEARKKDMFSGSTHIGPNRSDWKVFDVLNDIDANFCSAGEQKILICSIFLNFVRQKAQKDKRNLILLLDDVIAHLDFSHRVLLFKQIIDLKSTFDLEDHFVQIWLSGTDKNLFNELSNEALFLKIEQGTIQNKQEDEDGK